jgi:hypothetical protein
MLDVHVELAKYVVAVAPSFLILAILVGWGYAVVTDADYGVFMPAHEVRRWYSDFGGYGPTLAGAIGGIALGVLVETGLLAVSLFLVFAVDAYGYEELMILAATSMLAGLTACYWQYLEIQSGIREADWYQGW